MEQQQRVLATIYRAIDELNQQLPPDGRLGKAEDTALYTRTGPLDSLGIVNLVLLTEEQIHEEFGVEIDLASRLQSNNGNPFRDVSTLANHIVQLL